MKWLYKNLMRSVLFQWQAEQAHEYVMKLLTIAGKSPTLSSLIHSFCECPYLKTSVKHIHFPNPLGLAAGMDKNAIALPVWEKLGFGFCELGGITCHEQPGNPKPRMFRSPSDQAIVNRMGFNNDGLEKVVNRLSDWESSGHWPSSPVAINLGKSKVTPLDEAPNEYAQLLESLWKYGDFFVVNVSSPNTPDLRKLQQTDALKEVLQALTQKQISLHKTHADLPKRPIFLKIDPDMPQDSLDQVIDTVLDSALEGIVATNTTLARPDATNRSDYPKAFSETGGMSGRPLRERSTDLIRHIYSRTKGKITIIGVGGIFNARDAWEKIGAGASLVQAYSGMVYEGPGMARSIVEGLRDQVELHGLNTIQDAVGKELDYIDAG
jgi:dihydroorotate dehydrogenase